MTTPAPSDDDLKWVRKLSRFIRDRDALPSASGPRSEAAIARWLGRRLSELADGTIDETILAALDEHAPGWSQPPEAQYKTFRRNRVHHERTLTCADHLEAEGRLPTKTAKRPDVARLGEWLRQQRNASRGIGNSAISPERIALLDRILPGWDTRKAEVWYQRVHEIVAFVDANGRFPRHSPASADETRMHVWLYHQHQAITGDRRGGAPWQAAYLDKHLPGWRSTQRIDPAYVWTMRFKAAVAHVEERGGRIPTGHLDDFESARVSQWLARNLRDESAERDARWALLDEHLPGWRTAKANPAYTLTRDGVWAEALSMLVAFVEAHGRAPRADRRASPAERYLSGWVRRQSTADRVERISALDTAVPGWRKHTRERHPAARKARPHEPWFAVRLGDVVVADGVKALVIEAPARPDLIAAAWPGGDVRTRVEFRSSDVEVIALRTASTVRLAGRVAEHDLTVRADELAS